MVSAGDAVTGGQVIALAPSPRCKGKRYVEVMMWHNGLPLIPYEYIGNPESMIIKDALRGTERTVTPVTSGFKILLIMDNIKNIAILGSTGSIGTQTLDIIEEHPEKFRATVLTAARNWELLAARHAGSILFAS